MTARPDKHLLFVAHTGQVSGAEKVMLDLIRDARERGRSVTVMCPDGPLPHRLPEGVEHVRIPQMGLTGERGIRRLTGAARLVFNWLRAGLTLFTVSRRADTATIVNSAFALPAALIGRPPNRVTWLVHDTISTGKQRAVVRASRSAVRRAVAVSVATSKPLAAMGIPVEVAHNGVPWPVPALSTELHEPAVVGILALLTPWKGHLVLLDAIASLPDVVVELAGGSFPGDSGHVAALHERAEKPDLAGRVRFLDHTDLLTALNRWDVVVSSSVLPEAGPLSVLEAMSHGKPVVGTDHGGTTEFLHGGAGLLVPPDDAAAMADAIARLLGDGELRKSLAVEARSRIARAHDMNRTIPRMLDSLLA